MGIDWDQEDLEVIDDLMVVGSQEYPPHHMEGSLLLLTSPTIAEKGVEVGEVGSMSFTEYDDTDKMPQDISQPPQTPQTPSLSIKISGLSLEENECICSLRCEGHSEEMEEQDECLCTVSCPGVQTHSLKSDIDTDRMNGLKYCPGNDPVLPVYNYVAYKPSTSTGKFTIYKYDTLATGGEERGVEEAVGGRKKIQAELLGEIGRENETFRSLDMRTLISKWEDRAGGGEGRNELPLPTVEGGGRRKSQDFTELILKFTDQGKKDKEIELPARKLDVTSSTKLSFSTLGRGAVRKLSYNFQ